MTPTVGRIVHYQLTEHDVARIDALRAEREDRAGNSHVEGQIVPLTIVRTWGSNPDSSFNGRAALDGPWPDLWITSTSIGDGPGRCAWPPRA